MVRPPDPPPLPMRGEADGQNAASSGEVPGDIPVTVKPGPAIGSEVGHDSWVGHDNLPNAASHQRPRQWNSRRSVVALPDDPV